MYKRRSFNALIAGVIVFSLIIVIALVYAGFTGQLQINGTAVGRDSNWDIHFENVSSITTSGTAKVLSNHQPTINPNNRTQIQDYEVSLTSPNDSISFTFDVVNDGNYNAKVTDIDVGTPQCTSTDSVSAVNMCNNLTYTLTYAGGASVQANDVLYAKDKLSFKVTLQFNDISNPALLPTAGVSISNLGIEIDFEQVGGAEVDENTGIVQNNRVYHIGDEITLYGEKYFVITTSGSGQDYVSLLKADPLKATEINQYNGGDNNYNSLGSYGGYGLVPFYYTDECNSSVRTGCSNDYNQSGIKVIIDNWSNDIFINNELKEVNLYKARLLTHEEAIQIIPTYTSKYYSSYGYWTMTSSNNGIIVISRNQGIGVANVWDQGYVYSYAFAYGIRPVINVYKSALETNNDE